MVPHSSITYPEVGTGKGKGCLDLPCVAPTSGSCSGQCTEVASSKFFELHEAAARLGVSDWFRDSFQIE